MDVDHTPPFAIAWDEIQLWDLSTQETLWGARFEIMVGTNASVHRHLIYGLVGLPTTPDPVKPDAWSVNYNQSATIYATEQTTLDELDPWLHQLHFAFAERVKALHADLA